MPDCPPLHTSEELQLLEQILAHRTISNPVRGANIRRVIDYLGQAYRRNPDEITREIQLAEGAFGSKPDPGCSDVRSSVGRTREWLHSFFKSGEYTGTLRITIPDGAYRLKFERLETVDAVQPTDWFWGGSEGQRLGFAVLVDETYGIPEIGKKHRTERPTLDHESVLKIYRDFCRVTETPVEILGSRLSWLQDFDVLAVGLSPAHSFRLSEYWENWRGKHRPLVMVRDSNDVVFVTVPRPVEGEVGVYRDSSAVTYCLVTRISDFGERSRLTTIVASEGPAIKRAMQFLSEDNNLRSTVEARELGGPHLRQALPASFQILLRVPKEEECGYEEGYPDSIRYFGAEVVLVHILEPSTERW